MASRPARRVAWMISELKRAFASGCIDGGRERRRISLNTAPAEHHGKCGRPTVISLGLGMEGDGS